MRAYERLLNYVRVHTTSDENSGTHPSAEREFDLLFFRNGSKNQGQSSHSAKKHQANQDYMGNKPQVRSYSQR